MEQVFPDYYNDFACIASKCVHSCCVGWEIDIDSRTMDYYRTVGGAFSERLRKGIADGDEPHFELCEGERCPFLNSSGLCDIILELGESGLCGICADHPRFRSFFKGRTETGLGMCCEEAARLILSRPEPPKLVVTGEKEKTDMETRRLLETRERVFSALGDQTAAISAREDAVLELCGASLPEKSPEQWAEIYLSLERMDDAWTRELMLLKERFGEAKPCDFDDFMLPRREEYARMLEYFVYRHLPEAIFDGDLPSKAGFAVLSVRLLRALGALKWKISGSFSFEDQAELARLYSAEIEYSQENMDALYDILSPLD